MTNETYVFWVTICLVFAAISATMFPIMYMFSPWYKSHLGRALMFKAIAFAMAVDFTLLFYIWTPPLAVAFWISAFVYTFIAVTAGGLTLMLWYNNYYRKDNNELARAEGSEAGLH